MKVNKKFIASATSAALVASAIVPVASAASFSDIEGNTHKDAILALADKDIITGYTDGTFRPGQKVTRGNVTKLLGKWLVSEGYEIPADYNTVERFTDVPVTHGDQELVKYAALVKDKAVFNGSNGQLQQAGEMTRQHMAAVLVRAIKTVYGIDLIDDYKAADFKSEITDFDQANADYHEAITALEFAGLTTQKTFNPKGTVTRGQFASFLNRAIEYAAKQEVPETVEVESVTAVNGTLTVTLKEKAEAVSVKDFTVTQAINGGKAKEVTPSKAELAEDGKTVTLTVEEVAQTEAKQSVVYTVNKVAAEAFEVEAVEVELQVESVSANNLRTVDVVFNKALDENTVNESTIQVAGYTFNASLNNTNQYKIELSEDKKTATLTFRTSGEYVGLEQNEELTITVNGVKTKDGEEIKNFTKKVTVLDTTMPTVANIKTSAPNTFAITFSEPLKAAPSVKINGGTISNVTTLSADGKTLTVKAASLSVGEVKVEISGGQDFANLPIQKVEKTFTYEIPTDAPTVSVKESSAKTVTLKFDRDVTNVDGSAIRFSHTYKGSNEVSGDSGSVVTKISGSEYKITFENEFPPGTTKVYIDYTANTADADKIKDGFGNVLAPTTLTVTTEDDTVKPEVSNVAYDAEEGIITVTFSEDVESTTAQTKANYILRNSKKEVISYTGNPSFASNSTNKVELKVGSLKADEYTLEIKNVKDNAVVPNTMEKVVKTIKVADTVAPTLESAVNVSGTTVRVTFSKDMDSTDLVNKEYYLFNGKTLPAGTTVEKVTNKSVDVKLPAGTTVVGKTIAVNGSMKDSVGNKIGGFSSQAETIVDSSSTAITKTDIENVHAVAKNKIQFTVNQHLSAVDPADFKVTQSGQSNAAQAGDVTYVNNPDGTATVTVITDNTSGINKTLATDLNDFESLNLAVGALTNDFGVATSGTIDLTDVKDKIKAELTSAVVSDEDGNGQIDQIVITMSEDVKAGSIQASDFEVDGYIIDSLTSATGDEITLKLEESGVADTGATPTVTLVGDVEDLAGNIGIGAVKEVDATDGAAPVLVGAKVGTDKSENGWDEVGDTLVLTFSESIKLDNVKFKSTGVTLADLNDVFDIDLGGGTTDEALSSSSSSTTFDMEVKGDTLVITIKDNALSAPVVAGTTDINIKAAGLSSNKEIQDGVNGAVANSSWIRVK